jgi:hypothetical protein
MKLKRMLLAFAMVAGAATSGSALLAQGGEPSYSPEGAWFAWATIVGRPNPFPFMDTYTSDANNQGRSGTILCTLATGKFPSPTGSLVSVSPSAQGNWVQIAKNQFAFTAWRILLDEVGRGVGTAKFWGTLTVQTNDTFTGTMNAAYYYGQSTTPFSTITGTTVGTRIAIELP